MLCTLHITHAWVKGSESDSFRIDSGVGQRCFTMYIDGVIKEKMELERMEVVFSEGRGENEDYLACFM